MACNNSDRRQRRKQEAAVGAAASRMQGESRRKRWEPQPVPVSEEKAPTPDLPQRYLFLARYSVGVQPFSSRNTRAK